VTRSLGEALAWQAQTVLTNPELLAFKESVERFASERLVQLIAEAEATDTLPAKMVVELSHQGFMRLGLPVEMDGGGADLEVVAIAVHYLSVAVPVAGAVLAAVDNAYRHLLSADGDESVIDQVGVLPIVIDPTDPLTTIEFARSGEMFLLRGTAARVEGAGDASAFVVVHPEAGALIVDRESCRLSGAQPRSGLRGWAPRAVSFENVRAVVSGSGIAVQDRCRQSRLILLGAILSGLAEGAARRSIEHCNSRMQFGRRLIEISAVEAILNEMLDESTSAVVAVLAAARAASSREAALPAAAAVACQASRAAIRTGEEAIQLHGGYGYLCEYPVEQSFRDAITVAALVVAAGA